ncbi:hypothetical protein, partial [Vibrio cholerae]|uniref:hypothetical protein n=1 Tax=Vibrio cholerae TaxID=666 RepID=UPI001F1FA0D9
TPNNRLALLVGSNGPFQSVRSVSLTTTPQRAGNFDVDGTYNLGIPATDPADPSIAVEPKLSSVAVHPTGNYAIVTVRAQTKD